MLSAAYSASLLEELRPQHEKAIEQARKERAARATGTALAAIGQEAP